MIHSMRSNLKTESSKVTGSARSASTSDKRLKSTGVTADAGDRCAPHPVACDDIELHSGLGAQYANQVRSLLAFERRRWLLVPAIGNPTAACHRSSTGFLVRVEAEDENTSGGAFGAPRMCCLLRCLIYFFLAAFLAAFFAGFFAAFLVAIVSILPFSILTSTCNRKLAVNECIEFWKKSVKRKITFDCPEDALWNRRGQPSSSPCVNLLRSECHDAGAKPTRHRS